MPVACTLYEFFQKYDTDKLYDLLNGFETTVDDKRANDLIDNELVEEVDKDDFDLKITTTAVRKHGTMISCTIEYDRLKPRGHRAGERPWYKDVERFNVQFSEDLFDNGGFIVLGKKSKRGSSLLHLHDILGMDSDDYERKKIPSSVIEDLVEVDSKDSKTRTVTDVDEYTESASASGSVNEKGSFGDELESKGNTTWEMYESMDYDGVVGVSLDTVVFYGNRWEDEVRMGYLVEKVAPRILDEES